MEHPVIASGPSRGFTMIELLVVIAIISALSVGAPLAIGRSDRAGVLDRALFTNTHDRLRRLAVSGQQIRGLLIKPRGMFTA